MPNAVQKCNFGQYGLAVLDAYENRMEYTCRELHLYLRGRKQRFEKLAGPSSNTLHGLLTRMYQASLLTRSVRVCTVTRRSLYAYRCENPRMITCCITLSRLSRRKNFASKGR